ncbi:MAG: polysaccharide deacetylase family protein [Magnetococcales bacterium]|nr:polysaccharide deacetylase family protein [Nitrospirota bacterium]
MKFKEDTILTYHHINKKSFSYTVSIECFDRQMHIIKEMGFTTLHTGDLRKAIDDKDLNKKYIMITFDDGWLGSWVYAYPILKKYGHKAVFFVVSSWCGRGIKRKRLDDGIPTDIPTHEQCETMVKEGKMSECSVSWDEFSEMEASGCVDVQCHTNSHLMWDNLYSDREERLKKLRHDLLLSKQAIESNLNKTCDCLCWPYGVYD